MALKIKGFSSVFGGFLIHLTLGTFYTIGNMNTYITSYLRKHGENDLTYSSAIWINTGFIAGMGVIMFFAGILDRKVGTSITCAIGCAIFTISTALTYFSIKSSFVLVVITYGLIPAIGSGLAYAAPLVNSMKWFPHNKGIVTGITVGGFGLGALIFDQVQTLYLNPYNYSPKDDYSMYFVRASILNKVPQIFLVLSLIYGLIQLIGVSLIFRADKHLSRYHSTEELEHSIVEDSQIHSDISPRNALKSSNFYILWVIFALGNQTVPFINTLYKPFGQTFIDDDHYLALVGSLASIFNASGRIIWGKLMDKYNFKDCVIILFGMLSILMLTFIVTTNFGKVLYTIWILLIFFSFSGIFSLFPAVVAQTFGPTHANTIYGMLFTAPAVTGVLGAVILDIVVNMGWFYSFSIVGLMSLMAMVITMVFYR